MEWESIVKETTIFTNELLEICAEKNAIVVCSSLMNCIQTISLSIKSTELLEANQATLRRIADHINLRRKDLN